MSMAALAREIISEQLGFKDDGNGALTMSTITPTQSPVNSAVLVPEAAHPVSEFIDATETLYRLTVEEYEQIAGFLDDDRVELIDGYLVKKMVKNPPHVVACAHPRGRHADRPGRLAHQARRADTDRGAYGTRARPRLGARSHR